MRFDQSLPCLLQSALTVIIFFPPLGTQLFPVLLLQLGLCSLSLAAFLLPLNPQFVLFLFPLVLRVIPAMKISVQDEGQLVAPPAPPDGQYLQYPEILLRYLDLVQVDVAPGQGRPHQVAVAGADRGEGLAVVPRGLWAGPRPAERTEWGERLILIPWQCLMFDRD